MKEERDVHLHKIQNTGCILSDILFKIINMNLHVAFVNKSLFFPK